MIIFYIFLTLFYALANLLLGLAILKFFFRKNLIQYRGALILATGFLLGEGILASLWMFLGLAGAFKNVIIWAILILANILGLSVLADARDLFKEIYVSIRLEYKKLSFSWKSIVVLLLILILFFAIGSIILPPMSDGEAFNLVLAKIMAYSGWLKPPHEYFIYSQIGLWGEMHFATISVIADISMARFLVWLNSLVIIFLILGLTRLTKTTLKGQIVAITILFTSSVITNHITDGKIDVFSAALGLCAYIWSTQIKNKNWLPIIMTGLFVGWAVMTKLPNLILFLPIFLVVILSCYTELKNKSNSSTETFKKTIVIAVSILFLSILVYSPQMAKNKILFNKPFSTYFSMNDQTQWAQPAWEPIQNNSSSVVVPRDQSRVIDKGWHSVLKKFTSVKNIIFSLIVSPLLFTFWEYPIKGDNLSILVLLFLPLLLLCRPKNLLQKQILVMSLTGVVAWVMVRSFAVQPRYIISTLLLFSVCIATAVDNILVNKDFSWLKKIIPGLIIIVLIMCLLVQGYLKFGQILPWQINPIPLQGPHYKSLQFVNNLAKPDERVFLDGSYAYYLRADLLVTMNVPAKNIGQENDISPWRRLYNEGFDYVVLQKGNTIQSAGDLENNLPPDEIQVKKLYEDDDSIVYTLTK